MREQLRLGGEAVTFHVVAQRRPPDPGAVGGVPAGDRERLVGVEPVGRRRTAGDQDGTSVEERDDPSALVGVRERLALGATTGRPASSRPSKTRATRVVVMVGHLLDPGLSRPPLRAAEAPPVAVVRDGLEPAVVEQAAAGRVHRAVRREPGELRRGHHLDPELAGEPGGEPVVEAPGLAGEQRDRLAREGRVRAHDRGELLGDRDRPAGTDTQPVAVQEHDGAPRLGRHARHAAARATYRPER